MLKRIKIKNLTVFTDADLEIGRNLNVIVGENGAGKTHLLKVAYATLAASFEEGVRSKQHSVSGTKGIFQVRLAEKLVGVFRPEYLGRLARRKRGHEKCSIEISFDKPRMGFAYSFSTKSKTEVSLAKLPSSWLDTAPAYIPTRELLSIFPNFVSIYDGHYLEFEETWRDTCVLLGQPLQRGPKEVRIKQLLEPLGRAMGGEIELDSNGRFYLRSPGSRVEIPLVAEGLRKLGMLARLIATGALLDKGYLFWDEPEANLNPKLVRQVASSIVELSTSGIQIFIATHSLFLLREIEILLSAKNGSGHDARFFGLNPLEDGSIALTQGTSVDDLGPIASLDEELEQSDRFLDAGGINVDQR